MEDWRLFLPAAARAAAAKSFRNKIGLLSAPM